MRLSRHAAQRVQTMRPETGAKSFRLLPLIAFCTAAKAAQAPRLRVSAHEMRGTQTNKLLPCDPAFVQVRSSRLRPRESTHDQTTHDLMRIVSSAAAKAAQAQSLHLCYARGPNQKSFSRATRLFSRSDPPGCVLVNLHMIKRHTT